MTTDNILFSLLFMEYEFGIEAELYRVIFHPIAVGIQVKGDNHTVLKNMAFSPSYCATSFEKRKPHIIVPHWVGQVLVPFNNDTKVLLNIADYSNGGWSR